MAPAERPPVRPRNGAGAGKTSARPPAASRRRGLSFKEKHALETLPGRMDALQAEMKRLQAALADPGLYARDPKAFEAAAGALRRAGEAHAAAEEEWLALEMKREEAEAGAPQ